MSDIIHIGLPLFHVSLQTEDLGCALGVGAVFGGKYRALPGSFQKEELIGGVDRALASYIESFGALAGPFAGNADEDASFDLGKLVGQSGPSLVRHGLFIRMKGRADAEIRFGSESVIVLEVLLGLGNELAARTSNGALAAAWKIIAERCEILPMGPENWFERVSEEKLLAEAAWYARRVGQDLDYYVGAAKWLRARQFLFAMGRLPSEPAAAEYAPEATLDLPVSEDLDALVREASLGSGQSLEDFVADALSDRNIAVRQKVVFERWYGASRKDSYSPSP